MTTLRDQIQQVIDDEPVAIFMKGTPERPACGNSLRALQALWEQARRSRPSTSSPTPNASSEASISGRRPEVPIPNGTPTSRRWASSATAPGSGRRSGSSSRNSSPWRRWIWSTS